MPKLGLDNEKLMPCPSSPNCVSSQASDDSHFINPIRVNSPPSETKTQLISILEARPRTRITYQEANYIRAESVSRIFRFVDDIEFLLIEEDENRTLIHVRSASRLGYSDFDVNRKRVEQIRSAFPERDK